MSTVRRRQESEKFSAGGCVNAHLRYTYMGQGCFLLQGCEMPDSIKSNDELINEIETLRRRIKELESAAIERKKPEKLAEMNSHTAEELNGTPELKVREQVAAGCENEAFMILQNRQALLGKMMDHIAHQWKQPLNIISLIVQDLVESFAEGEPDGESLQVNTHKIINLVHEISRTVDDFRDFIKADKGKSEFRVLDAIEKSLSFLDSSFRFHKIKVGIEVNGDLHAMGMQKKYSQVLLAVLDHVTDDLLKAKVKNPEISIKGYRSGRKSIVTITDNAGGIPDASLEKIQVPDFSTLESPGENWIGLYLAKIIMERQMEGRMTVKNLGSGAEFRIEIPSGETVKLQ
jgi:C4-dicarboxylate-specific signal transduction histidine kinase